MATIDNNTSIMPAENEVQATQAERTESASRQAFVPAVDILEKPSETILIIDVPGVNDRGMDLTIEKNVLTIKAKPVDSILEGKNLVYSEYRIGEYQRSFSLSDEVDHDNITASIRDGVLRICLPKAAPVAKKITVTAS